MTQDGTRVCSGCGIQKSLSEFWLDARRPGGREAVCSACRSFAKAKRLGRVQNPRTDASWLQALLPALAQRLCALLHGEGAPACDVELSSPTAWHRIMSAVCQGHGRAAALRQAGISQGVFAAYLRYEPRLSAWYARAKQVSKRRGWPGPVEMESVLSALVRTPGLSARTACRQHDIDYRSFILRTQTPEFESRFLSVKSLQRDRSFGVMSAELYALGDGVSRATKRDLAQRVHALEKLEPRRGRPRKQLNPIQEARRRAIRRRP
jgi:hypothetical protein